MASDLKNSAAPIELRSGRREGLVACGYDHLASKPRLFLVEANCMRTTRY
jgi:hypothetical protein